MDEERPELDPYEELVRQEQVQAVALRLNVDPANVKPCFAGIGPVREHTRNHTAYERSTELRRMGVAEATAWDDLKRWNQTCRPPLSERELQTTFDSAWDGEKTFGCRGLLAVTWCIGREKCDWYRQNVAGRRKCRDEDYWDYHWPMLLTSDEARLYPALLRLEKLRGIGAGARVIASTRDYAELSGAYRGRVMRALEGLERHGLLIIMERGQKRSAGLAGRACHVCRVVPIPEPPAKLANERRETLWS